MSDQSDTSTSGYDVGYGKPPKNGQFKPGRSGNPKGRKKRSRSLEEALRSVMSERVTVRTSKGSKKLTKIEAMVQRITTNALSGDAAATRNCLMMIRDCGLQSELAEAIDAHQADRLMEEDQAILNRHLQSVAATSSSPREDDGSTTDNQLASLRKDAASRETESPGASPDPDNDMA